MNHGLETRNVTFIDGASLFEVAEVVAENHDKDRVTVDYSALRSVLEGFRSDAGWNGATTTQVFLAQDPSSQGQRRFHDMLDRTGFAVDACHFRSSFVSCPPGRSPRDSAGRSIQSFAVRIAYAAGLMARHANSQVLVVSHSFELYDPLMDLARRMHESRDEYVEGGVGLAFFGSLLDYRWKTTGILDNAENRNGGIKFFDLDQHSEQLLGIDLTGSSAKHSSLGFRFL